MGVPSLRNLQLVCGQIVMKKCWMAQEVTIGHEEKMKWWQP
jgi:hypothetical protein